jgi:mannose-6-phosphate isomerase-like protein (cupin superfamily)
MSYAGEGGEFSAAFRPSADVPPLVRSASSVQFIAPGSMTRGEFGLFRWEMKLPGGGPAPHFHRTFSESFYVLSGVVGLFDGARWVSAGAGDFLYVPQGGVHAFRNDSGAIATMLILFSPGTPRERFFQEMAEIEASGRQLSRDEMTEVYARHDQTMV